MDWKPRALWLARSAALAASLIAPAAHAQQGQESPQWQNMPHMQLERQFAGPLQDTIIQRWRDPRDGTVCYIYLPITAAHSAPTAAGFVEYGANTIGSISCFAAAEPARTGAPKAR
jgi:hypothetical protein